MTTQRQLDANRRNALRSTGPKTDEGKERSRLNAVTHGLTALEAIVISGENPEEFGALRAEVVDEFGPQGAVERSLVNNLVGLLWRLKRVPGFEAALIEAQRLEVSRQDILRERAMRPRKATISWCGSPIPAVNSWIRLVLHLCRVPV